MPRGYRRKPVPLRISGSVALVAKPEGASHTAGTALSTCMPVAMLAAWRVLGDACVAAEAGQSQEVHAHGRVAFDGQCPAVLGCRPMLRILVTDRPQRLDFDARFAVTTPDQVPALACRGALLEQTIEHLVVSLRRDHLDVDGDLVEAGAECVAE